MKNLFYTCIVTTLISLMATNVHAITPKLGIKGGLNVAFSWGPDAPLNEGFLPGVSGGVLIPLEFTDIITLAPEILFSMKGAAWDSTDIMTDNSPKWNMSQRLNYIEIPIAVRLRIPGMHPLEPYALIGPAVGLLLSAERVASMPGVKHPIDQGSTINKLDPSLIAGLGNNFILPDKKGVITLEGRFTMGLLPVDKDKGRTERNMCATMSLGYTFKADTDEKATKVKKANKPAPTMPKGGGDENWNN